MEYTIVIQYDSKDKIFVACIPDLPGCIAHGETQEEALRELVVARDLWLETAGEIGREIPKPSFFKVTV